jgi:hypothetical protein
MKYNIGDIVHNPNSLMVEVTDREIVCGINLYYTSDKMSYPENMLFPKFEIPKNKIDNLIKCLKPTELQPRTYEEYKKSISNPNYHFTSWLRKIISHLPQLRW